MTDIIGAGWSHPVRADAGGVCLVSGAEEIEQAIMIILSTSPGERSMRPDFGCDLRSLVFAPVDANVAGQVAESVRQALGRWEPRVSVGDVSVTADPASPGLVSLNVGYLILDTSDPRNLVVPFYTIPQPGSPGGGTGSGS
ncbi:GPW/gp25 family protein [Streptomyces yaizuensis]|uniref:GPW/gp25 family protein n=1 Tax=Streptomyces yaizuensis TaxID=2989713 RepID=A0ABQ5NYH3_9ACTN|nr:GPW/gp25 family protein [Streptomyces sp. YSPA8]GLF95272.1 GPW/gp25 family protein [Streptomyces sp. YSPA8]